MCIRDRGLASALLGEPPVVILEEPTNCLDPAGIHEIRNLIKTLPKRYDCTVLISSHMLLSLIHILIAGRGCRGTGWTGLENRCSTGFTALPTLSGR